MRIIFIGDIFGKIGRKAVSEILPVWKKKYKPNFVIANGENLAHGSGITEKIVKEVFDIGIDALTGGNHIFKGQGMQILTQGEFSILRPANYPPGLPGSGELVIENKDNKKLLIINLIGRVFFQEDFDDPFRKFDEIMKKYISPLATLSDVQRHAQHSVSEVNGILVDFHSEATSEQNAFAHYVDGRASAIVGTHTHIGTVDTRILNKGTAHVTDVGAVMAIDSVIGEKKQGIIEAFLTQRPFQHEPIETGLAIVSAVLIDIDEKTGKAKSIKRIDEEVLIK